MTATVSSVFDTVNVMTATVSLVFDTVNLTTERVSLVFETIQNSINQCYQIIKSMHMKGLKLTRSVCAKMMLFICII